MSLLLSSSSFIAISFRGKITTVGRLSRTNQTDMNETKHVLLMALFNIEKYLQYLFEFYFFYFLLSSLKTVLTFHPLTSNNDSSIQIVLCFMIESQSNRSIYGLNKFQQIGYGGQWCYCSKPEKELDFHFDSNTWMHFTSVHCHLLIRIMIASSNWIFGSIGYGVRDSDRWRAKEFITWTWANHSKPNWVWNKSHYYKTSRFVLAAVHFSFNLCFFFHHWFLAKYGRNHIWRGLHTIERWIGFLSGRWWWLATKNKNKSKTCISYDFFLVDLKWWQCSIANGKKDNNVQTFAGLNYYMRWLFQFSFKTYVRSFFLLSENVCVKSIRRIQV